ncbi:MAG: alpha/beta fold hydrolase [Firmicutes bacterium]|nr:alpha/beta fold hydrolase [Bacillota bacterium]
MKVEEIQIGVAEGLTLKGWAYWPGPGENQAEWKETPLLILCHGVPRSKLVPAGERKKDNDGGYAALAERCLAEGFPCFHFNFRGTGESEGNFDVLGWTRDLAAVLDYWEERDRYNKGFYLWGFSVGGAVSCCVAANDPRVKGLAMAASLAEFKTIITPWDLERRIDNFRKIGIIRDPSFPPDPGRWLKETFSVNPLECVNKIAPRPLLIVHGTEDEVIPVMHAEALYEQAGDSAELMLLDGAKHQLRLEPEAITKCLTWFKEVSKKD